MRKLGVSQALLLAPDSVNDIGEVRAVPEFPCRYRPQKPVVPLAVRCPRRQPAALPDWRCDVEFVEEEAARAIRGVCASQWPLGTGLHRLQVAQGQARQRRKTLKDSDRLPGQKDPSKAAALEVDIQGVGVAQLRDRHAVARRYPAKPGAERLVRERARRYRPGAVML
jgi:hypothetical protein